MMTFSAIFFCIREGERALRDVENVKSAIGSEFIPGDYFLTRFDKYEPRGGIVHIVRFCTGKECALSPPYRNMSHCCENPIMDGSLLSIA